MLNEHRERDAQAQRDRYAQAARQLRRWTRTSGYDDPTVKRLQSLLDGTAVMLEAGGFALPTGQLERAGLDAVTRAIERLVADQPG